MIEYIRNLPDILKLLLMMLLSAPLLLLIIDYDFVRSNLEK